MGNPGQCWCVCSSSLEESRVERNTRLSVHPPCLLSLVSGLSSGSAHECSPRMNEKFLKIKVGTTDGRVKEFEDRS